MSWAWEFPIMSSEMGKAPQLPANVPPDRVRHFRIAGGRLGSRPHETLEQLHHGGPDIVYFPDSPNNLLAGGVWVQVYIQKQ
jgi:hypothetical protein